MHRATCSVVPILLLLSAGTTAIDHDLASPRINGLAPVSNNLDQAPVVVGHFPERRREHASDDTNGHHATDTNQPRSHCASHEYPLKRGRDMQVDVKHTGNNFDECYRAEAACQLGIDCACAYLPQCGDSHGVVPDGLEFCLDHWFRQRRNEVGNSYHPAVALSDSSQDEDSTATTPRHRVLPKGKKNLPRHYQLEAHHHPNLGPVNPVGDLLLVSKKSFIEKKDLTAYEVEYHDNDKTSFSMLWYPEQTASMSTKETKPASPKASITTDITVVSLFGSRVTLAASTDKHGHTILCNVTPLSSKKFSITRIYPTSGVSTETAEMIDMGSTTMELIRTIDYDGNPIYVTRIGEWATATVTKPYVVVDKTSVKLGTSDVVTSTSVSKASTREATLKRSTLAKTTAELIQKPESTHTHPSSARTCFGDIGKSKSSRRTSTVTTTVLVGPSSREFTSPNTTSNMGPTPTANASRVTTKTAPKSTSTSRSCTSPIYRTYTTESGGAVDNTVTPTEATVIPLEWHDKYLEGFGYVFSMSLRHIKEMHDGINWVSVGRLAQFLRDQEKSTDVDKSLKQALIILLRGTIEIPERDVELPRPCITPGPQLVSTRHVAQLGSELVPMTASTQLHDGQVLVIDPLEKYKIYNPRCHGPVPTQNCGMSKYYGNRTECAVEACMWRFMRPINITTVRPMVLYGHSRVDSEAHWFAHRTQLTRPHWGISDSRGQYYPTRTSFFTSSQDGQTTPVPVRYIPEGLQQAREIDPAAYGSLNVHGDPVCHDMDTCHDYCTNSVKHHHVNRRFFWVIILAILVPLLLALCCCGCLALKRYRRKQKQKQAEEQQSPAVSEKLRRKSTQPPETAVVNTVTGEATDPATGQSVDPRTVAGIVAGPAAGASAANNKADQGEEVVGTPGAGDDGRGTVGRRVEEGRSNVRFQENPQADEPAQGPQRVQSMQQPQRTQTIQPLQKTQTAQPDVQEEEHVETVPTNDGASARPTGMQIADIGSMRGRKRVRPENVKANLAFWGR